MLNPTTIWPAISIGVCFLLCAAAFGFETLAKREWKGDPKYENNLKYLSMSKQFAVTALVGCCVWLGVTFIQSAISAKPAEPATAAAPPVQVEETAATVKAAPAPKPAHATAKHHQKHHHHKQ